MARPNKDDEELERIDILIKELQDRAKNIKRGKGRREELLKYLSEKEYSRADMRWAITQLEFERIPRKVRMGKQKGPVNQEELNLGEQMWALWNNGQGISMPKIAQQLNVTLWKV